MLSYIYVVLSVSASGDAEVVTGSGRKYEVIRYFTDLLKDGMSLSPYTVVRMKPNQPSTVTYLDAYDFMEIDLGETE